MRFLLAMVVCLLATAPLDAQLAATAGTTGVTVRGVTPNGEVILFGRTHQYIGGTPHLRQHLLVQRDDDGDGTITATIADLPPDAVWVVVDQESGNHTVAAPEGFLLRTFPLSESVWREGIATIDVESGFLDFVLVRPGKGAWQLDILQGSKRDDDARNDRNLRARVGAFATVSGKEKAPTHVNKKDVLAIIDPRTLDVYVKAAQ